MRTLTALSLSLFILLLANNPVTAQQEQSHSLQEDSNALQFRISPNFTLSSFTGATVSYKMHKADDKATRIGIGIATTFQDREFPDRANNPTIENFDLFLNASYTWMNYVDPDAVIKVFYGYGPGLNFAYDKNFDGDDNVEQTVKDRLFGLEALGYAGVEWFFHPSVSIHAEYGAALGLNFERTLNRQEILGTGTVNEDEIKTTTIDLRPTNVLFGISVYF